MQKQLKESGLLSSISMSSPFGHLNKKPAIDWMISTDGVKLGFRHWQASSTAPVILHLHGIEGHGQWFTKTASLLNSHDITIYALDRRGSGMNRDQPGHLSSYRAYLADLENALRFIRTNHPQQPIILMANCWSARAAAVLVGENYKPVTKAFNAKPAGIILTSPAIYTKVDLDMWTKYKIALNWLRGGKNLTKNWPIPLKPAMFTNNQQYLSYIQDDLWRLKEATTGFFVATGIFSWLARRAAQSISLPLIVIQSGADQIVDVPRTQKWYNQVKSKEKVMHIFPGIFHSIDFDENCFRQYTDILVRWIKSR